MKKIHKLTGMFLAAACALPVFAGCKSSDTDVLTVRFYNGGYGSEWLQSAADAFGAQHNVKVKLVPSAEYDCDASVLLKSGKNLPDLFIASSGTWREWVTSDYIEDLTDVYEAYTSCTESSLAGYSAENGGQIKIKDYLDGRFADYPYMQKRVGQGDFKPWILQWSIQPCGFAYNTDVLYATKHYVSNGEVNGVSDGALWNRFPETVSELAAYYRDIDKNNEANAYGKKIIQMGWSGVQANTLFSMIYTWWAQAQGVEQSNFAGEGTFFDFYNYGNTGDGIEVKQTVSSAVFAQSGLKKAYETIQSLFVDAENKTYKNSDPKVGGMDAVSVQSAFVSGAYAMMPASSWLEYEMRDFLDTDGDGKNDVNFEYHPIVSLDDYAGKRLTPCKIGDLMYVPAKAAHKDLAKQFLVYLSNEENNITFTKLTGSVKPFRYNAFEKHPDYAWTAYTKSVFSTFYADDTDYLYNYPKNVERDNVSNLYRYRALDFIGDTNVSTWLLWLKEKSAAEVIGGVKDNVDNSIDNWAQYYDMDVIK